MWVMLFMNHQNLLRNQYNWKITISFFGTGYFYTSATFWHQARHFHESYGNSAPCFITNKLSQGLFLKICEKLKFQQFNFSVELASSSYVEENHKYKIFSTSYLICKNVTHWIWKHVKIKRHRIFSISIHNKANCKLKSC